MTSQLTLDQNDSKFQIGGYTPGTVHINQLPYHQAVLVVPNQGVFDWRPQSIDAINEQDIADLLIYKPQLILLGTGEHPATLPAALLAPCTNRQIVVEVMTTAAACRTYVILSGEGRACLAALIL